MENWHYGFFWRKSRIFADRCREVQAKMHCRRNEVLVKFQGSHIDFTT